MKQQNIKKNTKNNLLIILIKIDVLQLFVSIII